MIYLINKNTDPCLNHAIEEFFLRDTKEDVYSLWRNEKTLLLGKNQDVYQEIDIPEAQKRNIQIVRRLSGGGTVYTDPSNMQYTFIARGEDFLKGNSFSLFAKPVVMYLKSLGLDATFSGRNDILIDGKKISGNAQYKINGATLHHGTLLFDVDLESIKASMVSRPIKFQKKAVKSHVSRIGTIKEYLNERSIYDFMEGLSLYIIDYYKIDKIIEVDDEIIEKASKYLDRFRSDEWNFGKDFKKYISYSNKRDSGLYDYKLLLKDGKIMDIRIFGDFFEIQDVSELEKRLIGSDYSKEGIEYALKDIDIGKFIEGLKMEDFVEDLLRIGE